jgi:hypothetical protein
VEGGPDSGCSPTAESRVVRILDTLVALKLLNSAHSRLESEKLGIAGLLLLSRDRSIS